MADEVEETTAEEAEFDAAFAEKAELSDAETATEDPGEVGAETDGEEEQEFSDAFDSAAGLPAASKEPETTEDDDAAKLAELEAENEALKQSERSQRGRVSALTKKLIEQRAADDQQPPEEQKVEGEGTDDEAAAEGEETNKDDDWDEFEKEFPEMAAIVDKRLASVTGRVDEVSKQVGKVAETTNTLADSKITENRQEQIDMLLKSHSDAGQAIKSQEYAQWKASAPAETLAKIKSHDAEDGIQVLNEFKEATGWKGAKAQETSGKSEVELINERRAKNLKNSAGISSKKVGHSPRQETESGDDFDDAFTKAVSKKEKQLARKF